jgi:hypothetical protein
MDNAVSQRHPNLIFVRRVLFISGLMFRNFSPASTPGARPPFYKACAKCEFRGFGRFFED